MTGKEGPVKRSLMCVVLAGVVAAFVVAAGRVEEAAERGIVVNPPGTYPIVDEKVTVDVMTRYSAVEHDGNYQDAAFTAWYEDLTNVRLNFVDIVEANAWQERLNLVLASGDLPEAIMVQNVMSGQEVFANGVHGNFIPVDDLIEHWMPALRTTLESYPDYASQIVMPDGKRYSFPRLEGTCYHCTMSHKMWVYKPWLDELGLDVPETTDDFYEMLVAFRNDDPNRTGRADTVPLAGAETGGWNTQPLSGFLMSAFIYTDPTSFLKRTNGRLEFVANTDEWREGVRYMARLYRDGLLMPDAFTQTASQLRSVVETPGAAVVGAVPAGWYGVFSINSWDGSGRFADFHPIAPLRGPAGVQQAIYEPYAVTHHTVITRTARHPAVIARLADWFFESIENAEIGHTWRFLDVDYRWLTEEEKASGQYLARDFSVADYLVLRDQTYGEDRSWDGWRRLALNWQVGGGNAMPPGWADDPTRQMYRLAQATKNLYEPYQGRHYMPPNLVVVDELQDELADVRQVILGAADRPGLVQQFYAEFVTGSRDIDNDAHWQAYVRELERAGVNRYVQIMQETLTATGY